MTFLNKFLMMMLLTVSMCGTPVTADEPKLPFTFGLGATFFCNSEQSLWYILEKSSNPNELHKAISEVNVAAIVDHMESSMESWNHREMSPCWMLNQAQPMEILGQTPDKVSFFQAGNKTYPEYMIKFHFTGDPDKKIRYAMSNVNLEEMWEVFKEWREKNSKDHNNT